MNFNIGDYVTRNSYGNDIVFVIDNIIGDEAILRGVSMRLLANSPLEDLVIYEEERTDEFEEKLKKESFLLSNNRNDYFYLPAKVLHIDADEEYLNK